MLSGISSTFKLYPVKKCCFLHLLNLILLMLFASIPVTQNTCCKKRQRALPMSETTLELLYDFLPCAQSIASNLICEISLLTQSVKLHLNLFLLQQHAC